MGCTYGAPGAIRREGYVFGPPVSSVGGRNTGSSPAASRRFGKFRALQGPAGPGYCRNREIN